MRLKSVLLSSVLAAALSAGALAADTYNIDTAHSHVGFAVKHLLVSTSRGHFKDFSGDIMLDEKNPAKSSVKVVIKAATIDTANEKRDNHLRSADFFEVEKHPEITFKSKKVVKQGDAYQMTGDLTIKGVTKEVTFPFTLTGPMQDPWGGMRLGAEGDLTINRKDFGVAMAGPSDGGIGDEVKISLNVEAVKATK
jgi:polyisoprenoid-binding protein YceI